MSQLVLPRSAGDPVGEFDFSPMQGDYGDPEREYVTTQEGVAVLNFSSAGKLEVSGQNAVQFLNGLVTNDIKALSPGSGALAAFLNIHAKLLALCRIYNTGSQFLLELDGGNREKVFRNLSRFVPAGGFFVNDVSDEVALISLQGPRAAEMISALTGTAVGAEAYSNGERRLTSATVLVAAHPRCSRYGFDLFVARADAATVWREITENGSSFGARAVGADAFEIARIESGIPKEPEDVNENHILLEAGFEEAISYTKGCYLGQEIIARIHWRGQPAKRLMGLRIEGAEVPARGTALYGADGKKVGEVTSSAMSPKLKKIIALGYVHRYYLTPGTRLTLKSGDSVVGEAEVVPLPFSDA